MSELTPIEQKEIEFHGREITAILVEDEDGRENIYVPLRPLVEGMGLDWSGQFRRVKENQVLNEVCISVGVTPTEIGRGKGMREMLSIPISHLNGFLFNINAKRVKDEIRPLLLDYQRECYRVLFEAFNGMESMTRFYRAIGHDEGWIRTRLKKHETSTDLSDMWLVNGVPIEHHQELQDILNEGVFGVSTAEHRQLKNIPEKARLKDNMTRLELLFSAIADEGALLISNEENPQGLEANTDVSKRAGEITRASKREFERGIGSKILSKENNLDKKKRPLLGDKDAGE